MRVRSFTSLLVWQRAMDLVVEVYHATEGYPKTERFVLTSHTRRTATSIPSNIAEGCCRGTTPAFVNHLNVALGSEGELFTQLELAKRLGFGNATQLESCLDRLSEVGRMLRGLVRSQSQ